MASKNEFWKNYILGDCETCDHDVIISEDEANSDNPILCPDCKGEKLPLDNETSDLQNKKLYGSIWEDMENLQE